MNPENPPAPPRNPLDPLTMQLVAAWIAAEREAGNLDGIADPSSIALDRVHLVLAGEVRWS